MILSGRSVLALSVLSPLALLLPFTDSSSHQDARPDGTSEAPSLSSSTAATVAGEDPEEWRDRSKPEQRAHWDKLEGKPAPSLSGLEDWIAAPGKSWADLRGKVVLLDFWATWCGPCREELPKVQGLHAKYGEKGFVALGVHAPRGHKKMADFVQAQSLGYAFAADKTGAFYEQFAIEFIPTYMVVDKRGVLRIAGANRAKITEIVEALMAEPAPSADEAPVANWPAFVEKKLFADKDLRGKQAPELHFGEWLTAAPELKGKTVLIDFWATWCPPCRKAIPDLNELHASYGEDLAIIGLSKEEAGVVREFTAGTEMHYALACDQSGKMSEAVGVQGIPHVLLISSDGIVRWQGFPFDLEDPLTPALVAQVLDSDPGVRARRKAREAALEKARAEAEKGKQQGDEQKGDEGTGRYGLGME